MTPSDSARWAATVAVPAYARRVTRHDHVKRWADRMSTLGEASASRVVDCLDELTAMLTSTTRQPSLHRAAVAARWAMCAASGIGGVRVDGGRAVFYARLTAKLARRVLPGDEEER